MLSLHQMSACPLHKNIFQSCLAKCALSVQGGQESNSFFSAVEIMAFGSRRSFLINGIFSKTFDQTGWSINFFQFAMVHKSNPVAERLGFLHIVSSKKDCEIFPVKLTKKIPHLSSGKGIHSGSRVIKKKNLRAGETCAT